MGLEKCVLNLVWERGQGLPSTESIAEVLPGSTRLPVEKVLGEEAGSSLL